MISESSAFRALNPEGECIGVFTLDSAGRLAVESPNGSVAFTIDADDNAQFGPPVSGPIEPRLQVNDGDTWLQGHLRVGNPGAYGQANFDPDGAISLGRDISAQPMSYVRLYRSGAEVGRIGLDGADRLALMAGAGDSPALSVREAPSGETGVLVEVHDGQNRSLRPVAVGPADSGGTGYRTLRVEN